MIPPTNTHYQITWTQDAHFINASCKEVDCPHFLNGWITRVVIGSPQEYYIKQDKSRKAIGIKVDDATVEYHYSKGQKCFRTHRVKLEKAPFFTVNQAGRETGRLIRNNIDFDEWTDRFNEQSYKNSRR
jgi:hypothetical protein